MVAHKLNKDEEMPVAYQENGHILATCLKREKDMMGRGEARAATVSFASPY